MAKNTLSKFLAGVAVIGTGVAVGLTLFKKLEAINRELDEDEYEDDDDFLSDFDEPDANDDGKEYVTINSVKAPVSNDTDKDTADAFETARDEAVEEFLKESIEEELAQELAEESAKELAQDLETSKGV
jgi:hypothetical protein